LAHAHQDWARRNSRTPVAVGVAGDEPARWPCPEVETDRARGRGVAPRRDSRSRAAPDRNDRTRAGVRAVPLGGSQREPGHPKRVRPGLAGTQLQTMRRARGACAMKKLVVVGNGMAGVGCVEQILRHAPAFDITILGEETHVNYNRILLSSVLAGEKPADEITL